MSEAPIPSRYGQLVQKNQLPSEPSEPSSEEQLDSLIAVLHARDRQEEDRASGLTNDPIEVLRRKLLHEFVPIFVELVEKYSPTGLALHMDASNFLEGGREIKFEFGLSGHRMQLHGTVTTEAIAFHETRHSPDVQGELVSGPMLRLRTLDPATFRNFVCERLTYLIRAAMRRR